MSLIAIDFDHTLTEDSGDPYKVGGEIPNQEVVDHVRWLKEEQNEEIVIWTARPWSQAHHIAGLLTMWKVPYNGIKMEKGGADVYLDDKVVNHTTDKDWKERIYRVADTSEVH